MASKAYVELCGLMREVATIGSIGSLLGWDQETYMPGAAAGHRAEQQSWIAKVAHERATSPKVGDLLAACESDKSVVGDPMSPAAAAVREMRRDYDLATKLPTAFVAESALVQSQAQEVWKEARQKSDFAMFAPWLEKVMELARRRAGYLGTPAGGEAYDALLDAYEPGSRAKEIEAIFAPLRKDLSALIARIAASKAAVKTDVLNVRIAPAKQQEFGLFVLKAMGFDLEAGRLDVTTHPFCSGMAPGDTRLTTRYKDDRWIDALYGTMHEAGHGLYEQGLPKTANLNGQGSGTLFGTPLADSISLGIHESQSRMWENLVGRSKAFWEWALPHAARIMGSGLEKFTADEMYRAVNTTTPSLIRVEADEGTYNLHVMVRFELERGLISRAVKVNDLPGEWNARYKQYLGVDVPDDRRGCLQDVHWSFGLVGYFPTYTLGNLYASQLWETIRGQIGDLDAQMRRGEFGPLKTWLNANVHAHGKRYRAGDLCKMLTGRPLDSGALLRHLAAKAKAVYGV